MVQTAEPVGHRTTIDLAAALSKLPDSAAGSVLTFDPTTPSGIGVLAALIASEVGDGIIGKTKLDPELSGTADGVGLLRVVKATFDPSAVAAHRTIAAHDLGTSVPVGYIVVGGFVDVITAFTDGVADLATIAVSVESANDIILAATVAAGGWTVGRHAIIPKANTPESTSIKATAARAVTATVAAVALTLGKAKIFLYCVPSDLT